MKKLLVMSLVIMLFAASNCFAAMRGYETLELDFKNPSEIATKAKWSHQDKIDLTNKGLGFDGGQAQAIDVSIETVEPFAIGYSWRPTQSVHIDAEITPPLKTITLPNGQTSTPFRGNLYVRYSPDAKHWSSWQVAEALETAPGKKSEWKFRGRISIPQKEREAYQNYLYAYYEMDVPWTSDEEAAVKWILKKEPSFFSQQIPFIGYLQFLFESQLYGGQRIEKIKIGAGYGVGGLATIPKDKKVEEGRSSIPWRFRG